MNSLDDAPVNVGTELCEICSDGTASLIITTMTTAYAGRSIEYQAPVWACDSCHGRYTAEGAEEAEQDAIRDALERLRPIQIRELRDRLGLTQAALGVRVRSSRDAVIRWEAGTGVQSRAADERLRELLVEATAADRRRWHNDRFKNDVSDRLEAAGAFRLHARI